MGIADLFKNLHGTLDQSKLIPFINVAGKRKGFPNKTQFRAALKFLEVKEENIYFDPTSNVHPIIYLNRFIYMPLHDLSMQSPEMWAMFRDNLQKQIQFNNLLEHEKDYRSIFEFMDKKLLIPTYIEIFDQIPDEQKYEIFVHIHVRSEYGFELFTHDFLKKVFEYRRFSKEYRKRMRSLKKIVGREKFTVYHGHNINHDPKDEYSWTLSKKTASFFANRFQNKGEISEKMIAYNDVIDFYDQRGEQEIILLTK